MEKELMKIILEVEKPKYQVEFLYGKYYVGRHFFDSEEEANEFCVDKAEKDYQMSVITRMCNVFNLDYGLNMTTGKFEISNLLK